jgi:F-type H+-transporting ATPase subunit gamma
MANLKEVRGRIVSVRSTQQITKAMKMVAAAKLRKAQNKILQIRPYAEKLNEILSNVTITTEGTLDLDYSQIRPLERVLIIPISSDRGLCGAFNGNINKAVLSLVEELKDEIVKEGITIMPFGKKTRDFFAKKDFDFDEKYFQIFDNLEFENILAPVNFILDSFRKEDFDRVYLVFNKFKNVVVQDLIIQQFLPVHPIEAVESEASKNHDYIFEPSAEYIVEELFPNSLRVQFFKALLESNASEHGARMTAMNQATDNAGELLDELQLTYNRTRQAAITKEILEIVGGAEALSQK